MKNVQEKFDKLIEEFGAPKVIAAIKAHSCHDCEGFEPQGGGDEHPDCAQGYVWDADLKKCILDVG